jgi:sec-independent protein translocase protein TatA
VAAPSSTAFVLVEELMFGLGFGEILLILLIVVLIFGTSRIPELGRGLGEGIKNFKKSVRGDDDDKRP